MGIALTLLACKVNYALRFALYAFTLPHPCFYLISRETMNANQFQSCGLSAENLYLSFGGALVNTIADTE